MYRYTECGQQHVWLDNGYKVHRTAHGRGAAIAPRPAPHEPCQDLASQLYWALASRGSAMPAVALFEAKNRLSELVDRVLAGEVIEITRHGKVVARLTPPEDDATRQRSAQDAVARLQEASRGVSLGTLKSRDLIREGRR